MYYLILPLTNIPGPPSQNYPVAPLALLLHRTKDRLGLRRPFVLGQGFFLYAQHVFWQLFPNFFVSIMGINATKKIEF